MNDYHNYPASSDPELDSLYAAITGRQAFSYKADQDPLYRSAADRYIQNGRMAMRDTMGQAAALTGGYGSSYAQAVGQQQYDEYLRSLAQVLPQYYSMAWQRYEAQGQALRDAYDLARQRRADDYARQRDEEERERAAAAAAQAAEARDYARQQDSYKQLYQLIFSSGYVPTDEELSAAGMSRAQADALLRQYLQGQKPQGGSRGGGRGTQPRSDGDEDEDEGGGMGRKPRGSGGGAGRTPSQRDR